MVIISPTTAERLADEILSTYHGKILSISIFDTKGNQLATKSVESFLKEFRILQEGHNYAGTLAIATLSIVNEMREFAGEAKAITATYEKCKMMLIPVADYEILVGFVLDRRVVTEEDKLASHIEVLVTENVSSGDNNNSSKNAATTT
jgi:hypothetical protein